MDTVSSVEKALVPVSAGRQESFDLLVIFQLAGQDYGLLASSVREIIRNRATTRVPNAGACIEGVINLRGQIIPVFNMRRRLELPAQDAAEIEHQNVMVVESGEENAGLLVDCVADVVQITPEMIDYTTAGIETSIGQRFIAGIVKLEARLVTLLNLEPLLAS